MINRNIAKTLLRGIINELYPFALVVLLFFMLRACEQ